MKIEDVFPELDDRLNYLEQKDRASETKKFIAAMLKLVEDDAYSADEAWPVVSELVETVVSFRILDNYL